MTRFAHWTYIETAIGWLSISGHGGSIGEIQFMDEAPTRFYTPVPDYLVQAAQELEDYFAGRRKVFTLKLDIREGTDFQQAVWKLLLEIPYGQTTTYLRIAEKIGDKKAVRAVGAAIGQNPIPIVIPCHRVISSDGDLTGFAGGLERKRALLAIENPNAYAPQQSLF